MITGKRLTALLAQCPPDAQVLALMNHSTATDDPADRFV